MSWFQRLCQIDQVFQQAFWAQGGEGRVEKQELGDRGEERSVPVIFWINWWICPQNGCNSWHDQKICLNVLLSLLHLQHLGGHRGEDYMQLSGHPIPKRKNFIVRLTSFRAKWTPVRKETNSLLFPISECCLVLIPIVISIEGRGVSSCCNILYSHEMGWDLAPYIVAQSASVVYYKELPDVCRWGSAWLEDRSTKVWSLSLPCYWGQILGKICLGRT